MQVYFWRSICAVLIAAGLVAATQEPVKPELHPRIITATKQVTVFSGLEKQLLAAIQKSDKAALSSMLSDDFVVEMPNADSLPGDEWLSSVTDKEFSLKSYVIRQVSVSDLGDTAVVKFDRIQEATFKGKNESGEFFVIDVWKKSGDSWKLANRYVAKVGASPSTPKPPVRPTGKQ